MAAKGYLKAFYAVKKSITKILEGKEATTIIENDLSTWFTALFSPSLQLGLIKASDLIGYRNKPVYIRNSHHPKNGDGNGKYGVRTWSKKDF